MFITWIKVSSWQKIWPNFNASDLRVTSTAKYHFSSCRIPNKKKKSSSPPQRGHLDCLSMSRNLPGCEDLCCLLVSTMGRLGLQSICTPWQGFSPWPSPWTGGLSRKFMVWALCTVSSQFSRQMRQGQLWATSCRAPPDPYSSHKSVPTRPRTEPLKRNHGNYMFAQGKWIRTFLSIFSSLPSFIFFLFFKLFLLWLWCTLSYHLLTVIARFSVLFTLTCCIYYTYKVAFTDMWCPEKKPSKTQFGETNWTVRC